MSGTEPTLNDVFELKPADRGQGGAPQQPELPIADALSVELTNAKLPPAALLGAVRDGLGSFLDLRLSAIIAGAWAKARLLGQYRDRSRAAPVEVFLLSLAKHSIQSKYKPSIEMLLNGKSIDSLPLDIGVQLAMDGLTLKIRNGLITELRSGKCVASGTIACRGYMLAEKKGKAIDVPGVFPLGAGIPIRGGETDGAEGRPADSNANGHAPATGGSGPGASRP